MRGSRLVGTAAVAASVLGAPRARGQDAHFQGLFTGSVGFTDNVANAPREHAVGEPGPQSDILFAVRPGVALLVDSPRAAYRIGYAFGATLYTSHSEANSYTNSADAGARFETTPTTNLFLGVDAEQGQLNALYTGPVQAQPPPQAQTTGSTSFVRVGAHETFDKAFSDVVSGTQAMGFGAYFPSTGQRGLTWDNGLGITRFFEINTLSLQVGSTYAQYSAATDAAGATIPASYQLLNRATLAWSHQYGRYVTSVLDAGALFSVRADDGGGRLWQPIGSATVHFLRDVAEVEIGAAHAGAPNLVLGTNTLIDSVRLRIAVPIAATYLTATGAGGFAQVREINREGKIGPALNQITADTALLWAPFTRAGSLEVALRYQFYTQDGVSTPPAGFFPQPSYARNTILFEVSIAYPSVTAATAPASQSAPYRTTPRSIEELEPGQAGDEGAPNGVGGPRGVGAPRGPEPAPGSEESGE